MLSSSFNTNKKWQNKVQENFRTKNTNHKIYYVTAGSILQKIVSV